MDWAKTTARGDEKHLSFDIWFDLYKRFYGTYLLHMWMEMGSCLLILILSQWDLCLQILVNESMSDILYKIIYRKVSNIRRT